MAYNYTINGETVAAKGVKLTGDGETRTLVDTRSIHADIIGGNVKIRIDPDTPADMADDTEIGTSRAITASEMSGAVTLGYNPSTQKVHGYVNGGDAVSRTLDQLGIETGGASGLISFAMDGLLTFLGTYTDNGSIVKLSLKHGENCTIAASGTSDTVITLNTPLAFTPTAYVLINDAVCAGNEIPISEFLVLFVMGTSKFELAGGSAKQLKTLTTASQAAISGASSFTVKGHNEYLLAAATNERTITAYFMKGKTS